MVENTDFIRKIFTPANSKKINIHFSNFFSHISKVDILIFIVKLIISLIIFLIFFLIARSITNKIKEKNNSKNKNSNKLLVNFITSLIFYFLIIIGLLFAIVRLGFDLSTLLVILGSAGIAIALSMQKSLSQIVSGITIIFFKYFNTEDLIQVNDTIGYVHEFNLFNTTLKDISGVKHIVSNDDIAHGKIINYTAYENIFLHSDVTISSNNINLNYKTLLEEIRVSLMKCKYNSNPMSTKVGILDISNPGTKIKIEMPIKSENYYEALFELNLIVRDLFSNNNILLIDNAYQVSNYSN